MFKKWFIPDDDIEYCKRYLNKEMRSRIENISDLINGKIAVTEKDNGKIVIRIIVDDLKMDYEYNKFLCFTDLTRETLERIMDDFIDDYILYKGSFEESVAMTLKKQKETKICQSL